MAFTWKDKKDMFKGEGIYFLTFNVNNRVGLLGELRKLEHTDKDGHIACVDAYDLGMAVYREFGKLQARHPGFQVIAKQIMPNHFHAVVWCHKEFGEQSVKMVARGFSQACSRMARELKAQGRLIGCIDGNHGSSENSRYGRYDRPDTNNRLAITNNCLHDSYPNAQDTSIVANGNNPTASMLSVEAQSDCAVPAAATPSTTISTPMATATPSTYDCGNGANTLFATPYIRTLCHAGQLDRMVKYTHNNPDNLQRVIDNPQYYTIRRNLQLAGLHFDGMGKERLLEYPDRYVVALSRSLSKEQIEGEVNKALRLAESGTIIYTAAMNDGEKAVSKAVREAGYPLVVMMLDGFPPEGTDAARFFHPNGVYHTVCGEGRLMLLAHHTSNYDEARLIELTEQELARKAAEKGQRYYGIPHDSKRWRMIAGNVMLGMIAGEKGC